MCTASVYIVTIEHLPDAEYPTSEMYGVYADKEAAIKYVRDDLAQTYPDNKIREADIFGDVYRFEVLGNTPEDYAILTRAEISKMAIL